MALAVETEDLGIAAGPQDRLVQAHEGLLYMDFADDGWRCEPLDPELLPPLFCAYARGAAAPSAAFHDDLRDRYEAGEERTRSGYWRGSASCAERGREALLDGRAEALGGLMSDNFDLRSPSWSSSRRRHVRMIELAGELGAGANYAGSGGAIVGVAPDAAGSSTCATAFAAEGCALIEAIPARVFPPGAGSSLGFVAIARHGAEEMPGHRSRGAGVQLQALSRVDVRRVLAGRPRRRDQGHPWAIPRRVASLAGAARPPDGARATTADPPISGSTLTPVTASIGGPMPGSALDRASRRGGDRHPAPAGKAQRALDRAAPTELAECVRLPSAATRRWAASCSPAPGARSARGWTRASSAATSTTADGWSRPAPLAFQSVGNCDRPVVAAVNGPALAGGLRACPALRPAGRLQARPLRLPRAAPRDSAELRGGAGGAAGDRRPGALPDGPRGGGGRGAAAGHRPRGRPGRRPAAGTSSPAAADRRPSRAARSSRPSAGPCSSAATCGASSSTRRSASSAAPCSARTTQRRRPPAARREAADPEVVAARQPQTGHGLEPARL